MASQPDLPDVKLDPASLYQEDVFTDRRAGTIRRLKPITATGADDPSRPTLFSGQTQLLTPAGVLPLGFDIEANTLQEAIEKFRSEMLTIRKDLRDVQLALRQDIEGLERWLKFVNIGLIPVLIALAAVALGVFRARARRRAAARPA